MAINRTLVGSIKKQLKKYPILALTGPRQSGKTTLLKNLFPDYRYLSLENPDTFDFAENDPNGFLKEFDNKVIFDEAQKAPKLFSYLQQRVDDTGMMGQYILSGSQNFHLIKNITQSLAGRVALFKLLPFDFQELRNAGLLSESYAENLVRGFYPAIYDRNIAPKVFYANYLQTYVECDISDIIQLRDIRLFRNFLGLCAARAGQLLNLHSIANECGISSPTAKSWLTVLESSYIIFLLQPYFKNYNKRITKSPKLYFYDTGLLCHLLKIHSAANFELQPHKGNLFKNYIVAEMQKRNYHQSLVQDIYFWRDSAGNEVDVLIEEGKTSIYEIKATQTVTTDLMKGLNWFEKLDPATKLSKTLIYAGTDRQKRTAATVCGWNQF